MSHRLFFFAYSSSLRFFFASSSSLLLFRRLFFFALLFRFFFLHILRRGMRGGHASILTGIFFGVNHLSNASSSDMMPRSLAPSPLGIHVQVQVVLSSLIGCFLGTRMLLTGMLQQTTEPLVLHILNNLLSCLLWSLTWVDWWDPLVMVSCGQTVGVFGYLLLHDLRALALLDTKPHQHAPSENKVARASGALSHKQLAS